MQRGRTALQVYLTQPPSQWASVQISARSCDTCHRSSHSSLAQVGSVSPSPSTPCASPPACNGAVPKWLVNARAVTHRGSVQLRTVWLKSGRAEYRDSENRLEYGSGISPRAASRDCGPPRAHGKIVERGTPPPRAAARWGPYPPRAHDTRSTSHARAATVFVTR